MRLATSSVAATRRARREVADRAFERVRRSPQRVGVGRHDGGMDLLDEAGALLDEDVDELSRQREVVAEAGEEGRAAGQLRRQRSRDRVLTQFLDRVEEDVARDRFGDEPFHPRGPASIGIVGERRGGHGDDRQVAAGCALPLADGQRRLETVHLWHLQVHQGDVGMVARELQEGLPAVAGRDHAVSASQEQRRDNLAVNLIVLDEQDDERSAAR